MGTEPWRNCTLCGGLKDREYGLWKAGDLVSGNMPAAEARLTVVGYPFETTDTSSGNSCLRQCPDCGTHYWWQFSYEYLVNGTEDEVTLTRLSPDDGRAREEQLRARIRAAAEEFRSAAPAQAELLRTRAATPEGRDAAYFFLQASKRGFDLEPCLPALAHALLDHAHQTGRFSCPGDTLVTTLNSWAATPERGAALWDAVERAGLDERTEVPPEVESLRDWLELKFGATATRR